MKHISLKRHLIVLLSMFVIPLILCLLCYNYYSIKLVNDQVAKNGNNTILLYQSQLEYDLDQLSMTIAEYWANDFDHINMLHKVDEMTRHLSGYEIGVKYRTLLTKIRELGAIFLISQKNDLNRYYYKEGAFDYATQIAMQEISGEILKNSLLLNKIGWQPYEINRNVFLFRMLGYNGGYTILVIDLNQVAMSQAENPIIDGGFLYFATPDGKPLSDSDIINSADLTADRMEDDYFVTYSTTKYMVVSRLSDMCQMRILYFIPYKGYFTYMGWVEILFLTLSVLMVLLIPVCYALISRSYFKPMNRLMETMKIIRNGNLDEKVTSDYRITEFHEFNNTFNLMVSEIKKLKIESFERELQKNHAQLQYLQLQIKPHFFLNCLKNLYGMVELKQYDKMQNLIIQISDYLRYYFKDNMSTVSIQEELTYAENYVALQKYSMGQDVQYEIEAEESSRRCIVPVMLIQPFVENSFKYGRVPDRSLRIEIRIIELQTENGNLLDISISDNGNGFSYEVLEELNGQPLDQYSENNVGIANVRQRLYLIYGDDAVLQCSNSEMGGSLCEMVFPVNMPKGDKSI